MYTILQIQDRFLSQKFVFSFFANRKLNAAAGQIGGGSDLGSRGKNGLMNIFSFFRDRKKQSHNRGVYEQEKEDGLFKKRRKRNLPNWKILISKNDMGKI